MPDNLRPDGSQKGSGFLGALLRPDGGVSSEISVGVPINGAETDIPTMVPTLTQEELNHLLNMNVEKDSIPDSIIQKAIAHAQMRGSQGKPYFAQPGEQQFDLYPELKRQPSTSDVPLASSRKSVDPEALHRLLIQRTLGK